MAKINYQFADGHYEDIEVTDDFKREYETMLADEKRIERKETRRHLSLEYLMELEERQNNWGELANTSLQRNQDTYSIVSSELDPLEVLIRREQEKNKPIVKALSIGLTDYQQRIAVEFYINNKTHMQIAEELGISRPAVSKIIKKVQAKVLANFV